MSDILKIVERIVQGRSSFTILSGLTLILLTVVAFRFENLGEFVTEHLVGKPTPPRPSATPPSAETAPKPAARANATPAAPRTEPASSPSTSSPAQERAPPAGSTAGNGCQFLPRLPMQSIDVTPGAILCDDTNRERASVRDIEPDIVRFVRDGTTVVRCYIGADRTCSIWPGAPLLRISMKPGGSNPAARLFSLER